MDITLTGNEDTDAIIINSLNLQDLRNVCGINKYAADLCQNNIMLKYKIKSIKERVNKIMTLVKKYKDTGIIIQPYEHMKFKFFNTLMKKINVEQSSESYDNYNDRQPDNLNHYFIDNIRITYDTDHYNILYDLTQDRGYNPFISYDKLLFEATDISFKEFLTNLYYDNLILTY